MLREEFEISDIATLYIGGGTPSLLPAEELGRLFKGLGLSPSDRRETTIEVNPESLNGNLLEAYESLGINRVSMGIQSLDEKILKRMGRLAGRDQALEAVRMLKKWSGTWSADYIFAYPGQTAESQLQDLVQLLSLEPPHFSLYQLTVEEGTALSQRIERGSDLLPDDEAMEDAWEQGLEMIRQAGYERYEISSFCRDGRYSRHNMVYWQSGRWLGLGAGAASMMDDARRFTGGTLDSFLNAGKNDLQSSGSFYRRESVSPGERVEEIIMMGLRTRKGVDISLLGEFLDQTDLISLFERTRTKWQGKVVLDDKFLRLNSSGMDWHSAVMVDMLLDLDKFF